MILTLVLIIGLFPAAAFADEDVPAGEPQVLEEEPAGEQPENKPVRETGVYYENGIWRNYENGSFKKVTGIVKCKDGKWRYLKNGEFVKATGVAKRLSDGKLLYVRNGLINKKATGLAQKLTNKKWVYVKNGVFNSKKTGLVKQVKGKQWAFVKKGKQVTNPKKIYLTKADKKAKRSNILAQVYARAIYAKVTNEKMTKKQKLKATFMYVASAKNYKEKTKRIPYYHGKDWPVVYANDMISDNASNCFGFSALYGYLAKLCGCKKVYWCAQSYHGWVEADGLVYDPIFLEVSWQKKLVFGATYKRAIAMNLGTNYDNSDYETFPWMRVKVPNF